MDSISQTTVKRNLPRALQKTVLISAHMRENPEKEKVRLVDRLQKTTA